MLASSSVSAPMFSAGDSASNRPRLRLGSHIGGDFCALVEIVDRFFETFESLLTLERFVEEGNVL